MARFLLQHHNIFYLQLGHNIHNICMFYVGIYRTVKFTTWVSAGGKTILAGYVFFLRGEGWIEVGSLFQSETSSFTTAIVIEKVYP